MTRICFKCEDSTPGGETYQITRPDGPTKIPVVLCEACRAKLVAKSWVVNAHGDIHGAAF